MEKERKSTEGQTKIRGILENLSETEQKLLSAVVTAERDKLYMQRPRGINDDLLPALHENACLITHHFTAGRARHCGPQTPAFLGTMAP